MLAHEVQYHSPQPCRRAPAPHHLCSQRPPVPHHHTSFLHRAASREPRVLHASAHTYAALTSQPRTLHPPRAGSAQGKCPHLCEQARRKRCHDRGGDIHRAQADVPERAQLANTGVLRSDGRGLVCGYGVDQSAGGEEGKVIHATICILLVVQMLQTTHNTTVYGTLDTSLVGTSCACADGFQVDSIRGKLQP